MQEFAHGPVAAKVLADDGEQDIDADRDPDLGLHGVWGGAVEAFDAEVLLDPFEEEFDTPAGAIELGDGEGGQVEVVGEEDEFAAVFDIGEGDAAERFGVEAGGADPGECDRLVAAESGGLIDESSFATGEGEIRFGAGDEEGFGGLKAVEPCKVHVAAIHDVDGTGFERELIEDGDVVCFARRNVDETGNAAAEIDQSVEFDGRLATAEFCPREEGEAEVDGGGVKGVDGVAEGDAERFVGVERPRLRDEDVGEVVIDPPIVNAIGVGESAS